MIAVVGAATRRLLHSMRRSAATTADSSAAKTGAMLHNRTDGFWFYREAKKLWQRTGDLDQK